MGKAWVPIRERVMGRSSEAVPLPWPSIQEDPGFIRVRRVTLSGVPRSRRTYETPGPKVCANEVIGSANSQPWRAGQARPSDQPRVSVCSLTALSSLFPESLNQCRRR